MGIEESRKIKSDETLISIINLLKEGNKIHVSEIADTLDIANSTVHGHLSTLHSYGLVRKTGTEYRLGLQFLDYGEVARREHPLYAPTAETIEELAQSTQEKVWCIVEENGQAVYLNGASGDRSVKTHAREGQHTKLHHLAAGKAILASLSPERVEDIIDKHGLPSKTENTITQKEELLEEIDQIREEGVAYNLGESVIGLHAIGVSIHDEEDKVMGAISISAPANRMSQDRMSGDLSQKLKGVANEIELLFRTDRY
ncbi:IclR family transcriptional regulator [Natronomonas halophila]|uniref:IclR family transcriptional regulator n=1 Tax=Natronomonas halophila TaxID=2747817 RepID=UPI0015B497C8|nr:IclR family transcriptional regulator [Natronomonas halophila]QLD86146.1 IclR family transcriptional regulator [Natronomonas halophila]